MDPIKFNAFKNLILQDHQKIHQQMQHLLNALNAVHPPEAEIDKLIQWLKLEAVQKHDYNEEILIFTKLHPKERLKEGGPFCVLYFDEHINRRPADRVAKLIQQELTYCSHQEQFKNQQSPLDIPLEEHRAIEALIESLNSGLATQQRLIIATELQDLFQNHHAKEERCFLKICEYLLTDSELDDIINRWTPLTI